MLQFGEMQGQLLPAPLAQAAVGGNEFSQHREPQGDGVLGYGDGIGPGVLATRIPRSEQALTSMWS